METRPKPAEVGPLIAALLSIALAIVGLLEFVGLPFAFPTDNSRIVFASSSVAIGIALAYLSLSSSRRSSKQKYDPKAWADAGGFHGRAGSASKPRYATKKPSVTGEVKISASMKPFAYYNLNVSLIGGRLPEQTVTVNGEVVELKPFEAMKIGPIMMVPHGQEGQDFDVQPAMASSSIPMAGQRHEFSFKVSPRSEHLHQTKLFVDFLQEEKLLARANAEITITSWIEQPSYRRIHVGIL